MWRWSGREYSRELCLFQSAGFAHGRFRFVGAGHPIPLPRGPVGVASVIHHRMATQLHLKTLEVAVDGVIASKRCDSQGPSWPVQIPCLRKPAYIILRPLSETSPQTETGNRATES